MLALERKDFDMKDKKEQPKPKQPMPPPDDSKPYSCSKRWVIDHVNKSKKAIEWGGRDYP